MKDSRIAGFYRMTARERIDALLAGGWLDATTARRLRDGDALLSADVADKMIENVIGVFGLPLAVAPNFRINGRDYVVPMVVEEPSIVAGISGAAKLARGGGGFSVDSADSLLIGQILLSDVSDPDAALRVLEEAKDELVLRANELQPNLQARGGGARDVELYKITLPAGTSAGSRIEQGAVVLHLLVDTRDAMGANIVNSMCEGIAPRLEELCSGHVVLRILSNLADRSIVTARATIPLAALSGGGQSAASVRDAIVLATDFAKTNAYRAATHNKGIMNGIDAVAIATGNDWRAIESAAHAYAARDGAYRSLTDWAVDAEGNLAGELVMPLKIGTVGGSLQSNPAVQISLELAGVHSAAELAGLMGAVGLAQNFAALRALVTVGIQKGHMRLHARSVAASAGTPARYFKQVVAGLVESGEIKVRKAGELLAGLIAGEIETGPIAERDADVHGTAAGKVILLGEHAAVYGRHVLALPLPSAVTASLCESADETSVIRFASAHEPARIQRFSLKEKVAEGLPEMLALIVQRLDLTGREFELRLRSRIPQAAGLGSSAAAAVAILRAFDRIYDLGLSDTAVNELAFACEQLAHGDPSGIDNTLATFARPVLFNRNAMPAATLVELVEVPPVVIATSGMPSRTKAQVAGVRERHARMTDRYDAIFDEIDAIAIEGANALVRQEYEHLGDLMNVCQGLLNAIGVSTPELEQMVAIARRNGAVGAKLTGAGGGGSIVALAPGRTERVGQALLEAGYHII